MADNFLLREINIGGKKIPVWGLALGLGAGVIALVFLRRSASAPAGATFPPPPAPGSTQPPTTGGGITATDLAAALNQFGTQITAQQTGFEQALAQQEAQYQHAFTQQSQSQIDQQAKALQASLAQQQAQYQQLLSNLLRQNTAHQTAHVPAVAAQISAPRPAETIVPASLGNANPATAETSSILGLAWGQLGGMAQGLVGLLGGGGGGGGSSGFGSPSTSTGTAPLGQGAGFVGLATSSPYAVVQSGNTLGGIARTHGLSLAQIIQLNPQIPNPNLIHPGQRITLS